MRDTQSSAVFPLMVFSAAFLLAACNDGSPQAVESDWVDYPTTSVPAPTSKDTPTSQPTPTPTSTSTPSPSTDQLYSGPAEVARYVQKFVDDAKAEGVDVTPDMKNPLLQIQIATLSGYGSSVIGLCESGTNQRRVTFSPTFWNSVDETQRELLAHHELGHCVLYRPHRSDLLNTGKYASIMYPIIMSSATYLNNTGYYLQELFTQQAAIAAPQAPETVTTHICDLKDLGLRQ